MMKVMRACGSLILSIGILGALVQEPVRVARESVTIPSETDQYVLNRVTQVSVGPDGRILVVDQGEHVILQFDSVGGYLGGIGRQGRGPGEFQSIAVGWLADTLYAIDAALGRVTYFDARGTRIRDSLLQSVTLPDPPSSLRVVRLLTGARAIGTTQITSAAFAPGTPLVRPLVAMSPAAVRPLATITVWPGELTFLSPPRADAGPIMVSNSRLGRLVSAGHLWTTTPGGTLLVAHAEPASREFIIAAVTFDGDTAFQRSFAYDPVPVPERLADSLVMVQARMLRGVPLRAAERSVRDVFRPIRSFPPVSHILATTDGQIWIAREEIPGRPQPWLVLDRAGRPQFRTATPPGFRAMAVGRDWVWGTMTDSLGAMSVRKLVVH